MKTKRLRVVIRQKINVGNFENIEPEVEIEAELDENDDPAACSSELHKMIQSAWAKQALIELNWVAKRRQPDQTKLYEYMQLTNGTRLQIKSLV